MDDSIAGIGEPFVHRGQCRHLVFDVFEHVDHDRRIEVTRGHIVGDPDDDIDSLVGLEAIAQQAAGVVARFDSAHGSVVDECFGEGAVACTDLEQRRGQERLAQLDDPVAIVERVVE